MGSVFSESRLIKSNLEEINKENENRTDKLISNSLQKISIAKSQGAKIIFIIQPEILPNWAPNGTGFRDVKVGDIQRINHNYQQDKLFNFLQNYRNDPDIKIIDLRKSLLISYKNYYWDESHLNANGNKLIADIITTTIIEMFE
jgi:hypothetical protein